MSFGKGDVVQVGKGKAEWTVKRVEAHGFALIESAKGQISSVELCRLTLIRKATIARAQKPLKLRKGKRGGKLRVA